MAEREKRGEGGVEVSGGSIRIVIVETAIGLVAGALVMMTEEALEVNQPRAIQTVQQAQGVGIALAPILGSPRKLILPIRGKLWWDVEDKKFIQHYVKETTGLVLASKLN